MDANISELDALQSSLPLLTERQLGESYGSMKNRLQKMKQPSEFGGIFEIIALAYLTETQISIHELGSESRYRMTACIPLSSESCGLPQIHLLHEVDTRDQPGHFDLLLNNQKSSVIDNEKSVSTRESGARLTFVEMVKIFCGCASQENVETLEPVKPSDEDEGDIEAYCEEEAIWCEENSEGM